MRTALLALTTLALGFSGGGGDLGSIEKTGVLRVLCVLVDEEPEFFADRTGVPPASIGRSWRATPACTK